MTRQREMTAEQLAYVDRVVGSLFHAYHIPKRLEIEAGEDIRAAARLLAWRAFLKWRPSRQDPEWLDMAWRSYVWPYCRRAVVDELRRRKRRVAEYDPPEMDGADEIALQFARVAVELPSHDARLDRARADAAVLDMWQLLRPGHRWLLEQHYLRGRKLDAIARACHWSRKEATRRKAAALMSARTILRDLGLAIDDL